MNRERPPMKYILICGASASGIGKGIAVSSIAALLKAAGHIITMIKIDPYLNIDAGTMSPYEHGEVYVLDDGGEADLDLGNYERFLNINLSVMHNITTGKVYQKVLDKERRGHYLGKTVQIVPHITDSIIEWILQVADIPTDEDFRKPEICLIELGGTVGDIESSVFLEALRQLQSRVGSDNMAICLVSFVPKFGKHGQFKTKPSQHGFKELRYVGLTPDFIFARSESPIEEDIINKLGLFSGVHSDKVINLPDLDSVYEVPLLLNTHKVVEKMCERLKIPIKSPQMEFWENYYFKDNQVKKAEKVTKIAFVGKYVDFDDAYLSVLKAFDQASIETGIKLKLMFIESEYLEGPQANATEAEKEKHEKLHKEGWEKLKSADAVFCPGGFGFRGSHGKLAAIKHARENKIPFFGICYGFQLAVIEFCRNVLGWNAITQENEDEYPKDSNLKKVIMYMPEINKDFLGGTMRLGRKRVLIDDDKSLAFKIYGTHVIYERHRHRYEVDIKYLKDMEAAGLHFTASDETRTRMEMIEMKDHPFFFATQFHPELRARLASPSAPFIAFVLAAAKKLDLNANFEGGLLKHIVPITKDSKANSGAGLQKKEKADSKDVKSTETTGTKITGANTTAASDVANIKNTIDNETKAGK